MRVLIARGAFAEMYEPAWDRALDELGTASEMFEAHALTLPGLLGRIERRLLWGPGISRLRRALVAKARQARPDVTLLYQGHYYDTDTVEELRRWSFVVGYHNDDPFGPRRRMLRYRHLLAALRRYDGYHVYRPVNLDEARRFGVRRVGLLPPYYLPWQDFPRELAENDRKAFGCDVVFAGHAEPDLRNACLSVAVRSGLRVRIHGEGPYWQAQLPKDVYSVVAPIRVAVGEVYRRALCAAKVATCFLSKWNRDRYTRRTFEIPACGVFLLAERTPEMSAFFTEGVEAEYFSSPEEFVSKARFYVEHDEARERIAAAGYARVKSGGHDIHSRMKQWLSEVDAWRHESDAREVGL